MKKTIAAALSSFLLAGVAFAQAPVQAAQPVAPAVAGRVITEPAQPAAAHKGAVKKHKAVKKTAAKKSKKAGGAKKASVGAAHPAKTAAKVAKTSKAAKATKATKAKTAHAKVH